jgi:DnaJ-domain-containing protein 1
MFNISSIFTNKKKKALEEREQRLDSHLEISNKLQEETKDTQKGTLEVARQNLELNKQLTQLVAENKAKENLLLQRETHIKISEANVEERTTEVRKKEIILEARNAEIRKNEQAVSEHEKQVEKREEEAEKIRVESEEAKEKYQILFEELEAEKEDLSYVGNDLANRRIAVEEKEKIVNEIFERSKIIDAEIKAKEEEFEKKREEIESSLKIKIEEYDRRMEDLNNVKEFVDNIKFDDSEDGKAAKIVVKEAIRQAKNSLADLKTKFDDLDEKYCGGTFKGFSTPNSEIDKRFEELKMQYQQIKEHIEANDLPVSAGKWLENIEDYINNADKNIKAWEFSEAYRNIIFGLATCNNYALLLEVLNEWGGGTGGEEETTGNETNNGEGFTDWYEVLDVSPDAATEEIKKKYRELAKKYHPDVAKDEDEKHEFEGKMSLINRAWEILEDVEKRKKFDEERKKHKA